MQAVPQCFVLLCNIVGKQQTVNDGKKQLLGFGCGQQGAPVLHYATWTHPKTPNVNIHSFTTIVNKLLEVSGSHLPTAQNTSFSPSWFLLVSEGLIYFMMPPM